MDGSSEIVVRHRTMRRGRRWARFLKRNARDVGRHRVSREYTTESLVLLYHYSLSSFFNRGMMLRERW
jgi:hypothetical protein